jgi:hypothetical protein
MSNFCPEVSYLRYGLFASQLAEYADEIDRDAAYQRLEKSGAESSDWRRTWSSIRPEHYTECSLYSVLRQSADTVPALNVDELIEFKPGIFGFSINIKNLITRFCKWWLRRFHTTNRV